MSSQNAPSMGASDSGSSRRHSMETICHPVDSRWRMISGEKGPERTSRIRSKCAIPRLRTTNCGGKTGNSTAKGADGRYGAQVAQGKGATVERRELRREDGRPVLLRVVRYRTAGHGAAGPSACYEL